MSWHSLGHFLHFLIFLGREKEGEREREYECEIEKACQAKNGIHLVSGILVYYRLKIFFATSDTVSELYLDSSNHSAAFSRA